MAFEQGKSDTDKGRKPDLVARAQLEKGNPKSFKTIGVGWTVKIDGENGASIKLDFLPLSDKWDKTILIMPYREKKEEPKG